MKHAEQISEFVRWWVTLCEMGGHCPRAVAAIAKLRWDDSAPGSRTDLQASPPLLVGYYDAEAEDDTTGDVPDLLADPKCRGACVAAVRVTFGRPVAVEIGYYSHSGSGGYQERYVPAVGLV